MKQSVVTRAASLGVRPGFHGAFGNERMANLDLRCRSVPSSPFRCSRSITTVAVLALSLAACQTGAVKDRVVEVVKPVAITPIKPADVPVLPAPLPKRPADARQALDLALSKVCEWVAFGIKADPLLRVSSGQAQQAVPKYPECER